MKRKTNKEKQQLTLKWDPNNQIHYTNKHLIKITRKNKTSKKTPSKKENITVFSKKKKCQKNMFCLV